MSNYQLSIVTVCYNDKKMLVKTMESVLNQNDTEFEYIVIDGNSKDGTIDVLNKYKLFFENKNIVFQFFSEKDTGIYNAMNKGIRKATGEWILFLNAGDLLWDEKVVSWLKKISIGKENSIIYGDVVHYSEGYFRYKKADKLESITYQMPFSHQAVFMPRELLEREPYDERYKICADYAWLLKMYLQKKKFYYVHRIISIYDLSGISSINEEAADSERYEIWDYYNMKYKKKIETNKSDPWKQKLKKYIPYSILLFRRKRNYYTQINGWYSSKKALIDSMRSGGF